MEMNPEALKWRAEDERRETFNALVLAYNKCSKSKPRKGEKQLAAWAMTKADRMDTLRRLMERYAKPGHKPFPWQVAKPAALDSHTKRAVEGEQ